MVRRLPGLLELEFNDGRPFASVETQEWLAAAAPAGGSAPASATPSGPSDNEGADDFTQKLREAHRIARGGNLQEAIDTPAFHSEHWPSSFWPRAANPGRLVLEGQATVPQGASRP